MAKKVPAKVSLNHSGMIHTPTKYFNLWRDKSQARVLNFHYFSADAGQESGILYIVHTGDKLRGLFEQPLKLTSLPFSAYN